MISDIHLDSKSTHVMEISPSSSNTDNDLDLVTFQKMIANINNNIQTGIVAKPQFIILLGDMVGHLRTSSDNVVKNESLVFNTIKNNFPSIPIFYVFGNNDSIQTDYGPFIDPNQSSPYEIAKNNANWKNGFLSNGVKCNINKKIFPCILTENTTDGFYSAYLKPRLRLISLNSVLFSPKRTLVSEKDALQELDWLSKELNLAENNHESVLIAMHIPPGMNVYNNSNFWLPTEQNLFLNLMKSHHKIIIGILASHTHAEEFKMIRDKFHRNIATVYFTAALSTSHGNEPSIKTFYFAKKNQRWILSNYETFHFTGNQENITLSKLYDYKSYYCKINCFENMADKMKHYFSAGNPNFAGVMKFPEDIWIDIQ